MTWQETPYTIPLLLAVVISAVTAFSARRRRSAPGAAAFILIMLSVAGWSLGYALQLAGADLPTKVFWAKFQSLGQMFMDPLILVFALHYTGRVRWLTRRNLALLSIEPLLWVALTWTNELHGLIWSEVKLNTSGPFAVLDVTLGTWVFISDVYSYSLVLISMFLLGQMFLRTPGLYRKQIIAMLIGMSAPVIGRALYFSGLSPFPHLDLVPIAFTITGLAIFGGFFRFHLLDIVPMAREAIIEGLGDGVIVLDAQNRIVNLNPAAQRIVGSSTKAIGRPVAQVLADHAELLERFRGVTEERAEIVLGEGETQRYFDLRISSLYDRHDRLTGRLAVLHDITERKRAEEALRESEERYRDLFENANDLIQSVTLDGSLVYVNRAWRETLGYSEEEIPGLSLFDIIHPDSQAHCMEIFQRVMAGEEFDRVEATFVTRDGRAVAVEGSVNCGFKDGVPVATRGIFRDITERRRAEEALRRAHDELELRVQERTTELTEANEALRAEIAERKRVEEALRESEEKYRDLVENVNDIIYATDEEGVITYISPAIESLSGYSPAEIIDRSFAEFIYQNDLPYIVKQFQKVASGQTEPSEYRIVTKSGEICWVRTSSRPVSREGRLIGLRGVMTDITKRKQAEEALRRAEAEARRRLEEQTALREAGAVITSTLDLADVLNRIAEQMGRALDATSAYINAAEPETRTSTVVAEYISPHACAKERVSDLGVTYVETDVEFLEALQAGQHWVGHVDEPDADEYDRDHMQQYGAKSILYIPLYIRGQALGYAELWESRRRREFTSEEIALCQAIAQNATIAIQNARLYEQARQELAERKRVEAEIIQRNRDLLTLQSAGAAITSSLDLQYVLDTVAREMANLLGAEACAISEWEQAADTVSLMAEYGPPERWNESSTLKEVYHLSDYPLTKRVLVERCARWIAVNQPDIDPAELALMQKAKIKTLLMLPMVFQDRVVGLVEVKDWKKRAFTDQEIALAQLLANQAASAIENARLYESERHQRQKAEMLLQTSEAVASSLDLGQVLLTLADQLLDISEFHICDIYEWEREAGQFRTLAEYSRAVWPPEGGETYRLSDYPTTERVLTTGQPEIIHVDMDDPELTWMSEVGLAALLMLPLRAGEEIIGLAEIGSPELTFAQKGVPRCQQVLQEAASWLKSPLWTNADDELLALAGRLSEAGGASWCALSAWYQPEGEVRTLVEYSDLVWPPGQGPPYHLADHPLSIRALKEGVSMVLRLSDPTISSANRDELTKWGGRTLVVQPLSIKGVPIGLVQFYNTAKERSVSDDELRLWRAVADQAAIAVENARLYERAQQEIAERRRAEKQIKASLREKELLLKEIHHRVKNNLQVISSMLYLQSYNIGDELALEMIRDSQNRVRSMALVHEKLYQSEDLAQVDFAEYIRSLVSHLFQSYKVNSSITQLKVNIGDVSMSINMAIPCGLILNELISNSLKHAFPDGRAGEIHVELRSDKAGKFTLVVSDNGIGLPQDLSLRETESLGLQLVNTLVRQLEGAIELDGSGGTAFKITFAAPV